jgi:small GTP-binding protein
MSKEKKILNQTITGNIGMPHNPAMDLDEENNNMGPKSQIDFKNLENYEFKIILIGDPGVGKTSIMSKFILNEFKSSYQSTLGVEFKTKELYINNTSCARLKIWDTCGQERFRSITRQYFKNSNGVFLVFDLSNKDTIKKLNIWLKDVTDNIDDDECVIFLIGNKMDIKTRDITISEEAKQFANDKKLNYYEVSARTGNGITNLFEKLAKKLVNNVKNKRNKDEGNIKNLTRNINIDDYSNRDRGKVEKNRNKFHCC